MEVLPPVEGGMMDIEAKRRVVREGIEGMIADGYKRYYGFVTLGRTQGFRTDYELAHDIISYLHSQDVMLTEVESGYCGHPCPFSGNNLRRCIPLEERPI